MRDWSRQVSVGPAGRRSGKCESGYRSKRERERAGESEKAVHSTKDVLSQRPISRKNLAAIARS